jgi:hypothetical protein
MGSVVLMHILSIFFVHFLSGILLFHFTLHKFRPDGGERKVCNNRNWLHHGKYFMLHLGNDSSCKLHNSVQVVMTLVSIPLMDKTGRRTLHLYGLGGMFIFSIFITISFLIKASIGFQYLDVFIAGLGKWKIFYHRFESKIKKKNC